MASATWRKFGMRNPEQSQAVVVLSGGMDSCVCAALAVRDFGAKHVAALHVSYGQRTEQRERRAFGEICDRLGIGRRLVARNQALSEIGGSALTDSTLSVPTAALQPSAHPAAPVTGTPTPAPPQPTPQQRLPGTPAQQIPITYVPFRNAHFLSVAVSWAEVIGAETIYIGAVEQDSSGYPDCRPEYYEAFNRVIRAGTKEGKIRIVTPLIAMRKAEIVRLGAELAAPFELTWSCYSGHSRACGECDSCILRLRAFAAAGLPDPIPYEARAASETKGT
jgi:7-cyano-7-deazaguanine synthase